jgi:hypothetical protein
MTDTSSLPTTNAKLNKISPSKKIIIFRLDKQILFFLRISLVNMQKNGIMFSPPKYLSFFFRKC